MRRASGAVARWGIGAADGRVVAERLVIGLAVLTLVMAAAGRVLVGSAGVGVVQPVDDRAREWVLAHLAAWSGAADILAASGATTVILVAAIAIAVVVATRTHDLRRALLPLLAVLVADLAGAITKVLVARPRPTDVEIGFLEHYSFPSGHTESAVALAVGVLLAWWPDRSTRHRALAIAGVVGIAVVVACGRLVADAHWATDVVAGVVVGVASAGIAWWALARVPVATTDPAGPTVDLTAPTDQDQAIHVGEPVDLETRPAAIRDDTTDDEPREDART